MAETKRATQSQITEAIRTLSEFAYETARARSLVDGTTAIDGELMRVVRDLVRAEEVFSSGANLSRVQYDAEGNPHGFGAHLVNSILRLCTLARVAGIDLGEVVVRRAVYNANRVKR